jgi:hypothetical protein
MDCYPKPPLHNPFHSTPSEVRPCLLSGDGDTITTFGATWGSSGLEMTFGANHPRNSAANVCGGSVSSPYRHRNSKHFRSRLGEDIPNHDPPQGHAVAHFGACSAGAKNQFHIHIITQAR